MNVATQSVDSLSQMDAQGADESLREPAHQEPEPVDLLPWLPCTLALEVPVVKFSVASLLGLQGGTLVETAWHQSTDVPLRVNGLLMAWTEFEVVGDRLAARITDLI